jgi:NADP-dependent 3-hydroxy acid dehydrogenase YdfG
MPRFAPYPERRTALVAGASSGIGAATAIELAARGFPVALAARRMDKCGELVEQIRGRGGEAIAVELDVTNAESVTRCVSEAGTALGPVELLVASAGDATYGRLHDIDTAAFEAQIQVHLVGANRLVTEVLPGMLERQRGQLIFVGSDVSLRQRAHAGAYGAAKSALRAMVNNLQMELHGSGVTASIVHPGPTRTNAGVNLPGDSVESMLLDWAAWGHARHPYSLRAQDVARAIAFVAETPRGGYIASMLLVPEAPLAGAAETN